MDVSIITYTLPIALFEWRSHHYGSGKGFVFIKLCLLFVVQVTGLQKVLESTTF